MEAEFYDKGGEGYAYHDSDTINNGSGKLNPANGEFLNEFRMKEGVDISYTKGNNIDNNPHNKVDPEPGRLYVGWTVPGEWINYSIEVTETATYNVSLMYTSNGNGSISFDLDGKPIGTVLSIPTTHDDRDTTAWRQWHHWNKLEKLSEMPLEKGLHRLTLHIVGNGNMNFDYFGFTKL